MKKLVFTLCIMLASSTSFAEENKVTGDMVLSDKASTNVINDVGYNSVSPYATTPRESSTPTAPVVYAGSYKVYEGRCITANLITSRCSCPSGYYTRAFHTWGGTAIYTCEQRG